MFIHMFIHMCPLWTPAISFKVATGFPALPLGKTTSDQPLSGKVIPGAWEAVTVGNLGQEGQGFDRKWDAPNSKKLGIYPKNPRFQRSNIIFNGFDW